MLCIDIDFNEYRPNILSILICLHMQKVDIFFYIHCSFILEGQEWLCANQSFVFIWELKSLTTDFVNRVNNLRSPFWWIDDWIYFPSKAFFFDVVISRILIFIKQHIKHTDTVANRLHSVFLTTLHDLFPQIIASQHLSSGGLPSSSSIPSQRTRLHPDPNILGALNPSFSSYTHLYFFVTKEQLAAKYSKE